MKLLAVSLLASLVAAAPAAAAPDLSITPSENFLLESDRAGMVARTLTVTNRGTEPIERPATRLIRDAATGQPGTVTCTPSCFSDGDWYYFDGTLQPGQTYQLAFEFYPPSAFHPEAPQGQFRFEATGRRTSPGVIEPLAGDPTGDNVHTFDYRWVWKDARATLGPRQAADQPIDPGKPFTFTVPLGNAGPDAFRLPLRLGVWGGNGISVTSVSVPGGQCGPGTSRDGRGPGIECAVGELPPVSGRAVTVTAVAQRETALGITLGLPHLGFAGDVTADGAYPFDDVDEHERAYSFCNRDWWPCGATPDPDSGGFSEPPGLVAASPTKVSKKRRFTVVRHCVTEQDCPAVKVTFSGRGISFGARTPAAAARARVTWTVKMPKRAFKQLRKKGKAVKFKVTGPSDWVPTSVKLKA